MSNNLIKIKRSLVSATPSSLGEGELAYSEVSGNLFIGRNDGCIDIIGTKLGNQSQTDVIQSIVGDMVTGTENGIYVTYDDVNKVLNFDVNDPTIAISGDSSGSATMTNLGNVNIVNTLNTVNSSVGTFGGSSSIPVVTVNAKGLVTNVSTVSINITDPIFSSVTVNGNISVTGTVDGVEVSTLSSTVNSHIGSGSTAHASATTSLSGFMSAADKQKLDALYTWYSNMTTADANNIIDTLNEMLSAFQNAPEGMNVYTELTSPTNMTLDGGTF
jgi:hypothetical protein